LAEIGLPLSPSWAFDDPGAAASFVQAHPGAYVVKASGADHAASDTFVGVLPDGRDVLSDLRRRRLRRPNQALILTSVIRGVEMGVGAYFNGRRFLRPACLDWEHKRFFPGDLGELTGEMGTVASFDRTAPFFERTLAKMEGALARHGHVGYVNLNTMVNEDGIWPLEFTCRFGYPGYAVLDPLQATPWGRLTQAMARGEDLALETLAGFCVGMVLTTPPFPYSRQEIDESVGHPVCFAPGADMRHHHFGEVGLDADGRLATSGLYGWTLVVTGVGDSLPEARRHALRNIKQVYVPNGRWRTDIGRRLIKADLARLERLGVFEP
jgi:phosphoribosylamine--glycine ligase